VSVTKANSVSCRAAAGVGRALRAERTHSADAVDGLFQTGKRLPLSGKEFPDTKRLVTKVMSAQAGAIGTVLVLRDQALESHQAGVTEQVGTDPVLLEGRNEDPLSPPAEELRQVGFAQVQRQLPEISRPSTRKGVELHLVKPPRSSSPIPIAPD
jgi:hypothetical protein